MGPLAHRVGYKQGPAAWLPVATRASSRNLGPIFLTESALSISVTQTQKGATRGMHGRSDGAHLTNERDAAREGRGGRGTAATRFYPHADITAAAGRAALSHRSHPPRVQRQIERPLD